MKQLKLLLYIFLALNVLSVSFTQEIKHIVISTLIGESLDNVEENYFNLFPTIKNFNEARFYLTEENKLNVAVNFSINGNSVDTLLENYSDINSIEQHIRNVVLANIKNDEQNLSFISTKNDAEDKGILFSADQNYITILNPEIVEEGSTRENEELMNFIPTNNIQSISVERTSTKKYTLIGSLIGTGAGLITGLILSSNRDSYNWFIVKGESAKVLYVMGITFLGTVVGTLVGLIIDATNNEYLTFNLNTPSGLSELQQYAPYQNKLQKKH
ncbi:MAG: hypothetical protein WA440_11455 [Ignavibacteriaceae bacterium]